MVMPEIKDADVGDEDTSPKVAEADLAGGGKVQVESEEIVTRAGKTYTRRRKIWVKPETAIQINQRRQATDWARSLGNYLPLYFIGNFVRDKYLSRVSESIDIVATVPLSDVANMLNRLSISFKLHDEGNSIILTMDGMDMRITAMDANRLVEQLSRSDFTINSIAQSVTGTFYDPFSGLADIKSRMLRSPYSNSKHAFRTDPTRIIRAAMYVGEFNMHVHPSVAQGISAVREQLAQVNPKIIGQELKNVMTCARPARAMEFLRHYGLLQYIAEALDDMVDMPQNQPKHRHDVWKHTMMVLKRVKSDSYITNLAILLHDIGKTVTANEDYSQFPDHADRGAEMTEDILQRLGFDIDDIKRISTLVKYHTFLCEDADKASSDDFRKVRLAIGTDMDRLIELTYKDRESCKDNDITPIKRAERRLRNLDIPENVKTLSPLSTSEITDRLGITGGSLLGEIQDFLHEQVLHDKLDSSNKKEAVKLAEQYVNDIKKSFTRILDMVSYERA